jgi:hypothetical protein
MAYSRFTRIIPIALILIIAVIAVAALISLARVVFFPSNANNQETVDTSRQSLVDTSVSHSVKMTVRGPIVANEEFRSYQIMISPSQRILTTYSGYLNNQIDNITLDNNIAAYKEFVNALDKANLAKGVALTGDKNDLSGICATGEVTDFAIMDGDNTVKELWTSTCSGSKGSLNANVKQLSNLFITQIPNADTTISKIKL